MHRGAQNARYARLVYRCFPAFDSDDFPFLRFQLLQLKSHCIFTPAIGCPADIGSAAPAHSHPGIQTCYFIPLSCLSR
jgi:hypothetical protein